MIELAPGHKQGLPVNNPIWIAGGMVGYGEAVARGVNLTGLGGVVVGPILSSSRAGALLAASGAGGWWHGVGDRLAESWGEQCHCRVMARFGRIWAVQWLLN